ncbi:MAG TPA: peptidoglycan-binding protein [Candidatus Paceibacterota bacterium]|nr:peptidoglycan-binding protein [Candidatus Paceibacterota bacterium]
MKNLKIYFLIGVAVFGFLFFIPTGASAVVSCGISRTLEVGVEGEDIRCLQKYLNESGFTITTTGVGSPGYESTQFKELTKKAVAKWQAANGIAPATGFFGPVSRKKYLELVAGNTGKLPPASVPETNPVFAALNAKIASLTAELDAFRAGNAPTSSEDKKVREALKKAIAMIIEAEDEIDSSDEHAAEAKGDLEDAREDFLEAVDAYLKNNFPKAVELADDAFKNAEDAFEAAGGETEEDKIDEFIEEVEDKIQAAENKINGADDNDEDVEEAEQLLEKASDTLDKAKDAFDNENFDEAENLAEKAEDLADDAVDAIGENSEKDDAKDALDDARDAIADAENEIEEADDDGKNTNEAENLLDEAKDKLDDAEEEFDDENYDEAQDLAKEAENLAQDAVDEL